VAARFDTAQRLADPDRRPTIRIMVPKFDHALLHRLCRIRVGWLNAEVVAIVSNHEDSHATAEAAGIPCHHRPVTRKTRAERQARLMALIAGTGADA
jgi:formyltetrahydrofolate deformylase